MLEVMEAESTLAYIDREHACNQGSIIQLANGELLLGFNQERTAIHSDSGQSCLIRSRDGGRTWDPDTMTVVYPYTDFHGNWDCAFAQTADGTILMHTRLCSFIAPTALRRTDEQALNSGHERLKRQTGYAIFKSTDNGHSWTGPLPVNTFPIASAGVGPYVCGGSGAGHIVELADGGLLMPLHGTITADGMDVGDRFIGETTRCFVLRSDDGGDNWEHWATVAYDPAHILSFQEPSLTRLQNGRLVCMMRVMHRPSRFGNMWFSTSGDDGATWTPPQRTNIWGYPPEVLQLQDGRVLAVYGYRREPFGVRGCLSDDGLHWDVANEFVIRDCVIGPRTDRYYWHIGYPSATQTPDGTIVAAYHEYSDADALLQYMRTTRFRLD